MNSPAQAVSCLPVCLVLAVLVVSATAPLPVVYMPSFLPTPADVTYHVGQEAVLPCAVENKGTRTIVWRKTPQPNPLTIDAQRFVPDTRITLHHQKHSLEWNLHIRGVRLEDEGLYECQVVVKNRDIKQFIRLNIDETPVRTPGIPEISINGTLFVERGNTLRLVCNATGSEYPPDEIDWFKDGNTLRDSDRISLSKHVSLAHGVISSVLEVRRAIMADGGTYVCRTSDLQVTSAKVILLNTETNIQEKRESSGSTSVTSYHYGHGSSSAVNIHPGCSGFLAIFRSHVTLFVTIFCAVSWFRFTDIYR